MPIHVECPSCRKQAQVPDSAVGKTVRCGCGTSFSVQHVLPGDELALQPSSPEEKTMAAPLPVQRNAVGATNSPIAAGKSARRQKKLSNDADRQTKASQSTPSRNQKILGVSVTVVLAVLIVYQYTSAHPSTGGPAPQDQSKTESITPANVKVETRRTEALDDLIHEFERTDGADWIEKDHIRGIFYVVMKSVPAKRQGEALNDLLTVSKLAPVAWRYIREPGWPEDTPDFNKLKTAPLMSQTWQRKNLEFEGWRDVQGFEHLPKGTKDTFSKFVHDYFSMAEDCWKRGTTVEAEAKKALGE